MNMNRNTLNRNAIRWQLNPTDRYCPVCIRRTYVRAGQNSKPLPTISSTPSTDSIPSPDTAFPFLKLIPEIRIKIYELCIEDATTCITPKTDTPRRVNDQDVYQFASGEPRNVVRHSKFSMKEHQCGDREIRSVVTEHSISISNVAPFPLLLVSKQLHNEVAALLYPKFSSLTIESSIMKSTDDMHGLNETDLLRWPAMREVTSLKITFSNELVKRFGESWKDVKGDRTKENSFMPWPTIPALLQVIEDLEKLENVEVEVQVLGDPSLTLRSKALQGDDCFSWLFPFREEVKRNVKVDIGFGKSGRCSEIYQRRWDELCKRREQVADDLPSVSNLAI